MSERDDTYSLFLVGSRKALDVLAHVRCPDHGRLCSGRKCCCRDIHWHPIRERWRWTRFDNYPGDNA